MSNNDLGRFVDAQERVYPLALSEIADGRKRTHWMWFIFPQIAGLGFSETSKRFALRDINEANDFFHHPLLGRRLVKISQELLRLKSTDATAIFGRPDDLKLKSSMTLFSLLIDTDPVFGAVLAKFFGGNKDDQTIRLIGRDR